MHSLIRTIALVPHSCWFLNNFANTHDFSPKRSKPEVGEARVGARLVLGLGPHEKGQLCCLVLYN